MRTLAGLSGPARVLLVHALVIAGSCGGGDPIGPGTGEGGGSPSADGGIPGVGSDGGLDRRDGADSPAADRAVRDLPAFERPQYTDLLIGECKTNDNCSPDKFCSFLKGCSPTSYACQHGYNVYCLMDPGHCKTKPAACTNANRGMCGCDGKTYQNPCYMEMAGQDLAYEDMPCP